MFWRIDGMSFSIRQFLAGAVLLVILAHISLLAQEPSKAPEGAEASDYIFRIHYEEVQKIMSSPLAERESQLETYRGKVHPDSKILTQMPAFFSQILQEYQKTNQTSKATALLEKIKTLSPETAAAFEGQAFQKAFQDRNYAKAISLGEALYASKPNTQLASMLAQSYISTQNEPKALEYSTKTVQALGANKGVYFAAWLASYHRGKGDAQNALKYYDQILQAFPSQGPPGWTAEGWSELNGTAHALKGVTAYSSQAYPIAIGSFEESLQYQPLNDATYLFLGLSQWKEQKLDLAIDAFAKGTVLNKPNSSKARQYLEQLFKARNEDSLDGLDALLDAARQALGI